MNREVKAVLACVGVLGVMTAFGLAAIRGVLGAGSDGTAPSADGPNPLVQRGAYLWSVTGCVDCHTPHENGKPIASRMMSGHPEDAPLPEWDPAMMSKNVAVTIAPTLTAYAGPFGVSVAPNLTPDKETGIGNLTADALIESWRSGKHWKFDRPIMPPMPYPVYSNLTDVDIRALHAFLMTLPPIRNNPPASRPAGAPPAVGTGGKA